MSCINCLAGQSETELYRGDDGHFRKRCNACGYDWGPFVSEQGESNTESQATLDSFT